MWVLIMRPSSSQWRVSVDGGTRRAMPSSQSHCTSSLLHKSPKHIIHFSLCPCYLSGKDQTHGIFCHTAYDSRSLVFQNIIFFSNACSYALGVHLFR